MTCIEAVRSSLCFLLFIQSSCRAPEPGLGFRTNDATDSACKEYKYSPSLGAWYLNLGLKALYNVGAL